MASRRSRFLNRELSWLEFNQRVLGEAEDAETPLLERLKFLAITASNLDEFFMVRVAGLALLREAGVVRKDPSGLTPAEQLAAIDVRVRRMIRDQYRCYNDRIEGALAAKGIRRVSADHLAHRQEEYLAGLFTEELFPVATPMAVTGVPDFPLLVNRALNIVVRLSPQAGQSVPRFAVIPIGPSIERFIALPADNEYAYMCVEDVICRFVNQFFPGECVLEAVTFRITRNADMAAREDFSADFLAEMERVVKSRRTSGCVRLEIAEGGSMTTLRFLQRALRIGEAQAYRIPGPLDLSDFIRITGLTGFDALRFEPWPPQASPDIDLRESVFKTLSEKNVFLYHPYDSFDPVLRFVEEAARDPDVLAIKQILYRTSDDSPVIAALKQAAGRGKSVTAIVELRARFDEARNIEWAKALEEAGVQVVYGVKGYKTHAKLCIVVRREPHGIVRYLHFGTGNYNEKTACLYSDASYMTRDPDLGMDASSFFNAITGYSEPQKYLKVEAAPTGLRDRLLELIAAETQRSLAGQKGRIIAKVNSLVDPEIIEALYKASRAGVAIQLNVRGICCLRPGVRGLSPTIEVISVVDRYLEHARLFYFHQGGKPQLFISSADWMPRNIDRRVELLVPIDDPAGRKRLVAILTTYFRDRDKAHRLGPDGSYERRSEAKGRAFSSQAHLYREACARVERQEQTRPTVFEPHLPPDNGI